MAAAKQPQASRPHAWLHAWPAWLVLVAAFFRLASPDVPLGLAWGRAIVEHGALPATNVFSHMNPDRIVLLDKWLFQVVIYLVHSVSGPTGLVCLRVALLAVALWAATRAARIRWDRLPHALLAVCFSIALLNRCYVRAELVTWAAIPLTLCLVPSIARGQKRSWLLLVLLQALWTNAHGYWVVGPMLWLTIGVGALLQPLLNRWGVGGASEPRSRAACIRLLVAVGVALAAACLTPYGVRSFLHPVRLTMELQGTDIMKHIVDDFGSPLEAVRRGGTIPFWACYVLGLGGVLAAVRLARRQRLDAEMLALFALGLLLGVPYYRNSTIMALCAVPLVAQSLRLTIVSHHAPVRRWHTAIAALPALLWLATAFGGWGKATDYGARRPGFGWHPERYPMVAANWIARNAQGATLWNDLGAGGWLNWRLGEGRSFIDGNTDGHPLAFLEAYQRAWSGDEIEPWLTASNGCTVALIEYGDERSLVRFLKGVSWYESPAFGFADGRYCVLLATADAPGADAQLTAALWREIASRIRSGRLVEGFSREALLAAPPGATDAMRARSRRLAAWLYPEGGEWKGGALNADLKLP
jgi:hypothetical protein